MLQGQDIRALDERSFETFLETFHALIRTKSLKNIIQNPETKNFIIKNLTEFIRFTLL